MKKRLLFVLLAGVLTIGFLTGCGDKTTTTATDSSVPAEEEVEPLPGAHPVSNVYKDKAYGFQLDKPEKGETVAILHTSMGDISMRFFPEGAPKAVENFLTHAKEGYYDGLLFYRVVTDFMIQSGDPDGNGSGGESIWGGSFADEFDKKLMNLRGAVSMANSGEDSNGSQFFINQAKPAEGTTAETLKKNFDYDTVYKIYADQFEQYKAYYGENFTMAYPTVDTYIEKHIGGIAPISTLVPDEVWELYAKIGGNIYLDGAWRKIGGHTVFAQVYDGMDVVDAIEAVETDSKNDKPLKDITIDSIEVTEY